MKRIIEALKSRKWLVAITAAVVVAGSLAVYFMVIDDGETNVGEGPLAFGEVEPGENPAEVLTRQPLTMLYRSGRTLLAHSIEEGDDKDFGEIPTDEISASPSSPWIAYATPSGASATPDEKGGLPPGASGPPSIHVRNLATEDDAKELGVGIDPVWDPLGNLVAFLRPMDPDSCSGNLCESDFQLVVADPDSGQSEELDEPGRYEILGWGGSHIYLSDAAQLDRVKVVPVEGGSNSIEVSEAEFAGVSPDGTRLLKITEGDAEVLPLEDGQLSGDGTELDVDTRRVLEGAWSHDSSRLALLTLTQEGEGASEILVFGDDLQSGALIDQTTGANGPLLWSPDNTSLSFVKPVGLGKEADALQAIFCPVGEEGSCGVLFTWLRDVRLLRLG